MGGSVVHQEQCDSAFVVRRMGAWRRPKKIGRGFFRGAVLARDAAPARLFPGAFAAR
jgi:hypothetical protein